MEAMSSPDKGTPSRKRSNDDRKSDANRVVTAVSADPVDIKKLISEMDTLKKTIADVTAQKESLERVCNICCLTILIMRIIGDLATSGSTTDADRQPEG